MAKSAERKYFYTDGTSTWPPGSGTLIRDHATALKPKGMWPKCQNPHFQTLLKHLSYLSNCQIHSIVYCPWEGANTPFFPSFLGSAEWGTLSRANWDGQLFIPNYSHSILGFGTAAVKRLEDRPWNGARHVRNAGLKPMHRNSPPSSKAMRLPLQIEALGLKQIDLIWSQPKTCSSFPIVPAWNFYTLTYSLTDCLQISTYRCNHRFL